jgi:hypothetical protein
MASPQAWSGAPVDIRSSMVAMYFWEVTHTHPTHTHIYTVYDICIYIEREKEIDIDIPIVSGYTTIVVGLYLS